MRALEFCCGSGGLAEGFARAGLRFELAIDRDGAACESYQRNVGKEAVQLDLHSLLAIARSGWRSGELDLVVADLPPARWAPSENADGLPVESELLELVCDLIRRLQPRAYLIAQSPGFEDGVRRVHGTIGGLNGVGYCVVDAVVLDAADFGVPQHRRRTFWFGHRSGACIRWPLATHGDPERLRSALPAIETRRSWTSCREALAQLPASDVGRVVRTRAANGGAPAEVGGERAVGSSWPWDAPCATVGCAPRISFTRRRTGGGADEAGAILLSERAGRLLQGLPESWWLAGASRRARWAQLGQAMPPALARAVGERVRLQLQNGD